MWGVGMAIESLMDFKSAELAELYDYWVRIRQGRRMAARRDVDPSEISHLLPMLFMVDVTGDIGDYRFRLFGTALTIAYGRDLTGFTLADIYLGTQQEAVFQRYREVVYTGTPVVSEHQFRGRQGALVHFERLLLPLSDDQISVNIILGGTRLFTPNFGTWGP